MLPMKYTAQTAGLLHAASKRCRNLFATHQEWLGRGALFIVGAIIFSLLSSLQKQILAEDLFSFKGYILPFLFGGSITALVGNWYLKTKEYQRKQAEAQFHYFDLCENANDLIQIVGLDGSFLYVNRAWKEALGYSKEELSGLNIHDVVTGECYDSCAERFARVSRGEEVARFETVFTSRDGRNIEVEGIVSLSYRDGEPMGIRGIFRDVTERKQAENEIRRLAYFDLLTGLPNRTLFYDRLTQALAQAHRFEDQIGVLFLDLDRFKEINDSLGHSAGDELLQNVSNRLRNCLRENDTVARLGGDEFVIILAGFKHEKYVPHIASKVLEALARPFKIGKNEVYSSTSIGIAIYPQDGRDVDTLLKHADMAMYAAKERGRNTYQFFSQEMNAKAVARMELEGRLRRAMEADALQIFYQPQIDLDTGQVVGLEALLRWDDLQLGPVPPNRFIPLAEETGLILPLGMWVLHNACAQNKAWQDQGLPALPVAVNLSGRHFENPEFASMVKKVLQETGLSPAYLELEITESILLENPTGAGDILRELKKTGVGLAIDDFGTGYSSLSYLKNFPLDRLKIDASFVRDITSDTSDAAIVQAIIAMADSLNLQVIAEGVEVEAQRDFLYNRHCHTMQGFLFSPAVRAEEISQMLVERQPSSPLSLLSCQA